MAPHDPHSKEFNELNNDPSLTEETLQTKLNAYRQALEQEFALAAKAADKSSSAAVQDLTRDFFKENSAYAAAQIAWLSMNAESESVRLSASKYVIERGLSDSTADGDPIKQMLESLSKKPEPTPEEMAEEHD